MTRRIAEAELRRLRNDVRIEQVIEHLDLPRKSRDGYLRFRCPLCGDFNTATNPRTNLGHCFRCSRNFNPIDLVVAVRRCSFLGAVRYLHRCSPPGGPQRA